MKSIGISIFKRIIISIAILVMSVVIGYFLLLGVFLIPISAEKAQTAIEEHKLEPYFPKSTIMLQDDWLQKDKGPDILDFSTDELIIKRSLSAPDESIFRFCINFYPRYWGGYVLLFRPLFVFFSLSEIRVIIFISQFFLSIALSYILYKKTGKKRFSIAWLSIYMLLLPDTLALNFQYASSYYIGVISSIVLVAFFDMFKQKKRYCYLFLVAGMCTAYFDFFTYPIFIWAISAVILILLMGEYKQSVGLMLDVVISFAVWIGGYAFFWGSKWVLSSLLTGQDVVSNAVEQVKFRQGAEKMILIDRFDALSSNWERLSFAPFLIVFLAWITYWIIFSIKKTIKLDYRFYALMLSIMVTPVWYLIIATQHVTDHAFFTWRNALSAVFAFFIIICLCCENEKEDVALSHKDAKQTIKKVVSLLLCLILAFISYYIVPAEKININNYMDIDIQQVIPQGMENAFTYSFIPKNYLVTEMDFLLRSEDQSGYYEISIFDGDKKMYTKKLLSNNGDTNILPAKVFWKLKKEHEYTIGISTEHMNEPATMWFTDVPVLDELTLNELYPLMGLEYRVKFQRKTVTIFYVMSWFSIYYLLYNLIEMLLLKRNRGKNIDKNKGIIE